MQFNGTFRIPKMTIPQAVVTILAATSAVGRDSFVSCAAAQPSSNRLVPGDSRLPAAHGRRLQDRAAPGTAPGPSVDPLDALSDRCDSPWQNDDVGASQYAAQSRVDSPLPDQRAIYNFETSTQGWSALTDGDSVSLATGPAYDGARSLAFNVHVASAGNHMVDINGPEAIRANARMSASFWVPHDAPVHSVDLYLKDGEDFRYTANGLSASQLRAGQWNALSLTAPFDVNMTQNIGLQVTFDAAWCGTLFIDSVGWDDNPTRDLSQSTDFLRTVNTPTGARLGLYGIPKMLLGYEVSMVHIQSCGASLPQLVDDLARIRVGSGANTVRMWFLQSAGGSKDFSRYELAVKHAKLQGLQIVPTLVNEWGDCEPLVNGSKNLKTLDWFTSGYKQVGDGYPESFRDFAGKITKHFANEPTIAFWQIGNELQAPLQDGSCDEPAATLALRQFADDMVQTIRRGDGNHLINLGTVGNDECGLQDDDWLHVHEGLVDITEVHDYYPANITLPDTIYMRILQSQALNKPIVVGEMGICRSVEEDGTCSGKVTDGTLQRRALLVADKLASYALAQVSGVSIWAYDYDKNFTVNAGDPIEGVMREAALTEL